MKIVAECRTYGELIAALKARSHELKATHEIIDEATGLPGGYTSKLFAPVPIKHVGHVSLGPLLTVLGVKIIVAVDEQAVARIGLGSIRRKYARERMRAKRRRVKSAFLGNSEWGKLMQARWFLALRPEQRSASARKAAVARWRKRA